MYKLTIIVTIIVTMVGIAFFSQSAPAFERPNTRVGVAAIPLSGRTEFEAYVDARMLPVPYDIKKVQFIIQCVAPNGVKTLTSANFHDKYLPRGGLYRKRIPYPAYCARWIRLVDVKVDLLSGASEDFWGAIVSWKQGVIGGPSQDLSVLPAPQIYYPTHGSEFAHYPRKLKLLWKRVPGASYYVVQLEKKIQGQWYSVGQFSPIYEDRYDCGVFDALEGRWLVYAVSSSGVGGYISNWAEFRWR